MSPFSSRDLNVCDRALGVVWARSAMRPGRVSPMRRASATAITVRASRGVAPSGVGDATRERLMRCMSSYSSRLSSANESSIALLPACGQTRSAPSRASRLALRPSRADTDFNAVCGRLRARHRLRPGPPRPQPRPTAKAEDRANRPIRKPIRLRANGTRTNALVTKMFHCSQNPQRRLLRRTMRRRRSRPSKTAKGLGTEAARAHMRAFWHEDPGKLPATLKRQRIGGFPPHLAEGAPPVCQSDRSDAPFSAEDGRRRGFRKIAPFRKPSGGTPSHPAAR